MSAYFIVGGAGFIGSHMADLLLADAKVARVTCFDNFSSGRAWHVAAHASDGRFSLIRGDVKDQDALGEAMIGHDTVIHLASNPDIAKAQSDPRIDFNEGTLLTQNVLEAMRLSDARTILYASGSGVYGDIGTTEAKESDTIGCPNSTYGASKIAGEALISSYCHMFEFRGRAYMFGNVVGARQSHGVGFDFIRRLLKDPKELSILGDGQQSKSYIHVGDAISAVLKGGECPGPPFMAFNVATGDYISVKEIADLALECLGLDPKQTTYRFSGGDRGWKGDVPIVRISTERIKSIGWQCRLTSRKALKEAMLAMIREVRQGLE